MFSVIFVAKKWRDDWPVKAGLSLPCKLLNQRGAQRVVLAGRQPEEIIRLSVKKICLLAHRGRPGRRRTPLAIVFCDPQGASAGIPLKTLNQHFQPHCDGLGTKGMLKLYAELDRTAPLKIHAMYAGEQNRQPMQ